jgi:hypothetical protein
MDEVLLILRKGEHNLSPEGECLTPGGPCVGARWMGSQTVAGVLDDHHVAAPGNPLQLREQIGCDQDQR